MQSINRVILTGNLTRDPEQKTAGELQICNLRLAVNTRRKNSSSGQWEDKPNYFDVVVFGAQGENCARFLAKGRAIAVDGRLDWREWESEGGKRQAVQIVADTVQFLGDSSGGGERSSNGGDSPAQTAPPVSVGAAELMRPPLPGEDDDIPFLNADFPVIAEIQPRGTTYR